MLEEGYYGNQCFHLLCPDWLMAELTCSRILWWAPGVYKAALKIWSSLEQHFPYSISPGCLNLEIIYLNYFPVFFYVQFSRRSGGACGKTYLLLTCLSASDLCRIPTSSILSACLLCLETGLTYLINPSLLLQAVSSCSACAWIVAHQKQTLLPFQPWNLGPSPL